MTEEPSDYNVAVLNHAIRLANTIEIQGMQNENVIAARANLINRLQVAIASGDTITGEEIKKIIEDS